MSKLAVPAVFIFYRDALDTYARLTATPAEAALRVLQILLATLSALPHEASHGEHQCPRAFILRPSARLSRRCPPNRPPQNRSERLQTLNGPQGALVLALRL